MTVAVLACGWGLLAAMPFMALAPRLEAGDRARALRARPRTRRRRRAHRWLETSVVARVAAGLLRARGSRRRRERVRRELPVAIDLAGVAVGAGCTPWQAVGLAAEFSPATIAGALAGAVRATTLGASFDRALADASRTLPEIASLTDALRTGARTGAPIAPVLARVAHEARADSRRRAEARARTVPVRLLFPLVFCTLPAFVLLTVTPVVLEGFRL